MIKWKVQEKPTGRYASFQKRGWPTAHYAGGEICARIDCEDDYRPSDVKEGKHAPLIVYVADHSQTPWQWRKVKGTRPTLKAAKDSVEAVIKLYPQFQPKVK